MWTKSRCLSFVSNRRTVCVVVVAGLQQLTSLLAGLLNTDSSAVSASDNNRRNLFRGWGPEWETTRSLFVVGRFTLSLILSALSGSPPPAPRFLNSVMFRSFPYRDVNVSHKSRLRRRAAGRKEKKSRWIPFSRDKLLVYIWSERSVGVGQFPSKSAGGTRASLRVCVSLQSLCPTTPSRCAK